MKLDKEDFETQVTRLLIFSDPKKSKLRPFLALFGIKNYVLLKNKNLINNNPSVKWYLNQLARAGVSDNYWGVRRQLKRMARLGIFTERKILRPVDNSTQYHKRLTKIQLSEFYLNEKVYLGLYHTLRKIFSVESLAPLFHKKNLRELLHNHGSGKNPRLKKKQTSKRTEGVGHS